MPIDLARLPVEIGFILAHAATAHEFTGELQVQKADGHHATSEYLIDDVKRGAPASSVDGVPAGLQPATCNLRTQVSIYRIPPAAVTRRRAVLAAFSTCRQDRHRDPASPGVGAATVKAWSPIAVMIRAGSLALRMTTT